MDRLKVCRKKKTGMFLLSCFIVFCIIYIYPICFLSICKLLFLNGNSYLVDRNLLDDLIVVVFALPGSIPWCIRIKEYFCILLDIKKQKKMTVRVRGCEKPSTETFDTYVPGNENNIYFYWKAKDVSNKKYKFLLFKDLNILKGKTTKHNYVVTCYKYSKIITSIEKMPSNARNSSMC